LLRKGFLPSKKNHAHECGLKVTEEKQVEGQKEKKPTAKLSKKKKKNIKKPAHHHTNTKAKKQ